MAVFMFSSWDYARTLSELRDFVDERLVALPASEIIEKYRVDARIVAGRRRCVVWRAEHIGHVPQRRIRGQGFLREHVEKRAAEGSALERGDQCGLVDDFAAA